MQHEHQLLLIGAVTAVKQGCSNSSVAVASLCPCNKHSMSASNEIQDTAFISLEGSHFAAA